MESFGKIFFCWYEPTKPVGMYVYLWLQTFESIKQTKSSMATSKVQKDCLVFMFQISEKKHEKKTGLYSNSISTENYSIIKSAISGCVCT